MSVFVRQNAIAMEYTKDAWAILNPIEQSIKAKIEKYGTPLKDWDVSIYRGVLTGCNEAFIISGEKRKELIAEDPKSDEIIRPILRGRDIKRYGYEFADLWLIATFPSKHYDIDDYPAVKKWLQSFGKKLEQTGEEYIDSNGIKQKCRKKTNNKWFETQDNSRVPPCNSGQLSIIHFFAIFEFKNATIYFRFFLLELLNKIKHF